MWKMKGPSVTITIIYGYFARNDNYTTYFFSSSRGKITLREAISGCSLSLPEEVLEANKAMNRLPRRSCG